jgi:hypothetical protein
VFRTIGKSIVEALHEIVRLKDLPLKVALYEKYNIIQQQLIKWNSKLQNIYVLGWKKIIFYRIKFSQLNIWKNVLIQLQLWTTKKKLSYIKLFNIKETEEISFFRFSRIFWSIFVAGFNKNALETFFTFSLYSFFALQFPGKGSDRRQAHRATRVGEFSPNGRFFLFWVVFI